MKNNEVCITDIGEVENQYGTHTEKLRCVRFVQFYSFFFLLSLSLFFFTLIFHFIPEYMLFPLFDKNKFRFFSLSYTSLLL